MKIQTIKNIEYRISNSCANSQTCAKTCFGTSLNAKESPIIDGILKNKLAQNLFKIAGRNPHLVQVISVGILGLTLRPATLLVVPGAEKEDKQYVAAKSIIGTALFVASQLLVSIPLDKSLKKIEEIAQKNPTSVFNHYSPKQLKAYNFLISNAVGLALTLTTSSYLTIKLTTKIMNKLFPQKKSIVNSSMQKPQREERVDK